MWAYAPLFLWIGLIFYMSSDHGSMSATSKFIRPLLTFLFPLADEATLDIYHGYIRKSAHLAAYTTLGVLACRAFAKTRLFKFGLKWVGIAVALVVSIALIDEFNQSFNPSRTGSLYDVAIDISGGISAIVAFYLIFRWRATRILPDGPVRE